MPAQATVKGGFWPENGVGVLTQASGSSHLRHNVARALGSKSMWVMRDLMYGLTGYAPGQPSYVDAYHVSNSEELGGKRPITKVLLIDRPTTAADQDEIVHTMLLFNFHSHVPNPPINKDMNPLGTR